MIIEEFGDREIYAADRDALARMSLHEVIAIEMGTLTLPLEDAIAWVREHVTVRPGFREFAERSAGHPLERFQRADRAGARARGRPRWKCTRTGSTHDHRQLAADLAGRRAVRGVRRGVQAAGLPKASRVVYVGDGYSDRCAALAADRVFARDGLARYLDREGVAYEPFEGLPAARRPPDMSLSGLVK